VPLQVHGERAARLRSWTCVEAGGGTQRSRRTSSIPGDLTLRRVRDAGAVTATVDVQGIPISYTEIGDGRPILLVHGWSADHRYLMADFEPIFADTRGWRRIYPDLPGHGATPAPSWLTSQSQMSSIVSTFADSLLDSGQYAMVGSSYGGYVALGAVRTRPERLRGVALVIPDLPAADGSRQTEPEQTVYPDRAVFDDLADDEQWIPTTLVVHERRMLAEIRKHDMPAYRTCDREFLERLNRQYLHEGIASVPGRPFLGPSLVATGRQDATTGFRAAMALVDELPRATVTVADLAGHNLGRVERPHLFVALVEDWLERLDRAWPLADS
jgi:pimeloyl-ACP methyl ester carboxylesterase